MRLDGDHRLLAYVVNLEIEVDRLRRHNRAIYQEARPVVDLVHSRNLDEQSRSELKDAVTRFGQSLDDLRELPGYHPAHDHVVALAIRPMAEQVFRWQRRLQGAEHTELRFELAQEHVEWFPARLRHILDNLISNALRYRDENKSGTWVKVGLRVASDAYELRVSDNGQGMPADERHQLFELFYRATLARVAGVGVGLAVVKLLIEQSGGSLTVDSGDGQGSTFVANLPRFDVDDFLGERISTH
jgi:signal transduction histidine kinase